MPRIFALRSQHERSYWANDLRLKAVGKNSSKVLKPEHEAFTMKSWDLSGLKTYVWGGGDLLGAFLHGGLIRILFNVAYSIYPAIKSGYIA